jgi:4-hydroxybenzoate polyprenyltransferase
MPKKLAFINWNVWLELLRLPNLFTVPGDILVGWVVMGMKRGFPFLAIIASLAFYSAGLLFNDLFDAAIDARERPRRPIPSHRISKRAVFSVASILSLVGLLLCICCDAFYIGCLLLGLILFYDIIAKHILGLGVVVMGLCRGVNILLGTAMTWGEASLSYASPYLKYAALFFTIYILIVSIVARNEVKSRVNVRWSIRLLPFMMVMSLLPLSWWNGSYTWMPILVVAGYFLCSSFFKLSVPKRVAFYIRGLIPLQGLWCILFYPQMDSMWTILFLSLWCGAWMASRRFAGS